MRDYEIAYYVLETIDAKMKKLEEKGSTPTKKGRRRGGGGGGGQGTVKPRLVDKLLMERLKVHADFVIARAYERWQRGDLNE